MPKTTHAREEGTNPYRGQGVLCLVQLLEGNCSLMYFESPDKVDIPFTLINRWDNVGERILQAGSDILTQASEGGQPVTDVITGINVLLGRSPLDGGVESLLGEGVLQLVRDEKDQLSLTYYHSSKPLEASSAEPICSWGGVSDRILAPAIKILEQAKKSERYPDATTIKRIDALLKPRKTD